MRNKILTVDDSKTVRIIVRKAFKPFDIELFEASNGVEGLAVAAKDLPDLILLDVTMPVMDGVEMLTKIKADPQLKGIPVMMLTAEGGRENVLKIAKIGVRDYLVKPFKEESLLEKAGRIIDLKPLAEGPGKARSILDPVDVLIVEDKPAIIQQIQDGLKHTPWKIHGVTTPAEAMEFCARKEPDLLMISLSLPEDAAFTLFRSIRTNVKLKFKPVFALVVKTEMNSQSQAQQVGFSSIITKPIDLPELEGRMAKAMNLDTSLRYFRIDGRVPRHEPAREHLAGRARRGGPLPEAQAGRGGRFGPQQGDHRHHLSRALHMGVIKILMQAMQTCRDLAMHFTLVGNGRIIAECKGFEDTRSWAFFETLGGGQGPPRRRNGRLRGLESAGRRAQAACERVTRRPCRNPMTLSLGPERQDRGNPEPPRGRNRARNAGRRRRPDTVVQPARGVRRAVRGRAGDEAPVDLMRARLSESRPGAALRCGGARRDAQDDRGAAGPACRGPGRKPGAPTGPTAWRRAAARRRSRRGPRPSSPAWRQTRCSRLTSARAANSLRVPPRGARAPSADRGGPAGPRSARLTTRRR